jgi:60 kDa SS-A/Ro ribonucleoprotein
LEFRTGSKHTPQREPTPGNSAGDHAWRQGDWARLDRFLVLGSDGGTYYVGEPELTVDNAAVVARCLATDGIRTIDRIVAISDAGRAPKNDPANFSLAMAAKLGDEPTRRAAYAAVPRVCRIGTHLNGRGAQARRRSSSRDPRSRPQASA